MADYDQRDVELERQYLAETAQLLTKELERLTASIDESTRTIQEQKEFLWAHQRDMDFAEKANFRTEVNMSVTLGDLAVLTRQRVERLLESPYFGRVDFHTRGEADAGAYYIGVHDFSDPDTQKILIHDWRAPCPAFTTTSSRGKRSSRRLWASSMARSPGSASTRSRAGALSTCSTVRCTSGMTSCSGS